MLLFNNFETFHFPIATMKFTHNIVVHNDTEMWYFPSFHIPRPCKGLIGLLQDDLCLSSPKWTLFVYKHHLVDLLRLNFPDKCMPVACEWGGKLPESTKWVMTHKSWKCTNIIQTVWIFCFFWQSLAATIKCTWKNCPTLLGINFQLELPRFMTSVRVYGLFTIIYFQTCSELMCFIQVR